MRAICHAHLIVLDLITNAALEDIMKEMGPV